MKLCYFNDFRLGVVKGDQVVDVTDAVKDIPHLHTRDLIIGLIERWDAYKAKVEKAAVDGKGVALSGVRLRAPVPRPGNLLPLSPHRPPHLPASLRMPRSWLTPSQSLTRSARR